MDSNNLRLTAVANEWHARPTPVLEAPLRVSHLVVLRDRSAPEDPAFRRFCENASVAVPSADARYHLVNVDACLIKWERHTEALSYTIQVPAAAAQPFANPALDFLQSEFRDPLVQQAFFGVHVEVIKPPGDEDPMAYRLAQSVLGTTQLYGGLMNDGEVAMWTGLRLDANGFMRLLVVDLDCKNERISRLIFRLLDTESYRLLAMLGLPVAREVMTELNALENELDSVMERLSAAGSEEQEALLQQISKLAARTEHIGATHSYRFAASQAYADIVERRLSDMEETKSGSVQRYGNFLLKTLRPAMNTCSAADRRISGLGERVSRAARLLNAIVDTQRKAQNLAIQRSAERSSRLQLRLQQSVEGFSIMAISYYAVGLLGYALKAAGDVGLTVPKDLITGIAAPVVVIVVWLSVRRVRHRVVSDDSAKPS